MNPLVNAAAALRRRDLATWRQDLATWNHQFTGWRRTRPFWPGAIAMLGGIELYSVTAVPFSLLVVQGVAGIASLIIGLLIVLLAGLTWFQPQLRTVTGLIIVVLGLASILLSNLGGFLIGMVLALHGGATMMAWKPRVAVAEAGQAEGAGGAEDGVGSDGGTTVPDAVAGSAQPVDAPAREAEPAGQPEELVDTRSLPILRGDRPVPSQGSPAEDPEAGPDSGGAAGHGAGGGEPATLVTRMGGSDEPSGRRRGWNVVVLPMIVAALLAPAATAAAATTSPGAQASGSSSWPCTLLGIACPAASPSPTPTPSTSATGTPSATPTPTSSTGTGGTGTATPTPTPTSTGTTPTVPGTSGNVPCTNAAIPTGKILPGSAKAKQLAAVFLACKNSSSATQAKMKKAAMAKAAATAASGLVVSPIVAHLTADKQSSPDLVYHGVATLNASDGSQIQALHFTASKVTLDNLKQTVALPQGTEMTLAPAGSVVLDQNVELYVTSMTGQVSLFGIPLPIPGGITLSPGSIYTALLPQGIPLPITVTGMKADVPYQSANSVTAPGALITSH